MGTSNPTTLDKLWKTLGLDSLPEDAGTAAGLDETRTRDWENITAPGGAPRLQQTEREDLPRLSLTPPRVGAETQVDSRRDLVVTGLLGEGGMARVLLAHQASLGREVAVKVPRPNATPGTITALLHEAQTTGGLEHPAVIPVYSMASDSEGNPALVMKRVDGVAWSELLRDPDAPTWKRVASSGADRLEAHLEILRQVCNAIAFAHRKGVIHRDIKPANVLIGEFGEVYVADWGIATRKLTAPSSRRPGLVGTPVYLAPEMVTGEDSQLDERTDVFLLGATLYHLLAGTPPWSGPDLRGVLEVALTCQPRPPPASAPAELVAICQKAMSPDRRNRYATALELRDALGDFLHHRGSVKLTRAADDRLRQVLAAPPNLEQGNLYAKLSECRFGFTQALAEWPQNEAARTGLARCIEATARHELAQGNLDAARALLKELTTVPAELRDAVAKLEREVATTQRQKVVLQRLSQEMDPRVALRQRLLVFGAVALGVCAVVLLPRLSSSFKLSTRGFAQEWYLTILLSAVMAIFFLALWLGRRALLSTRLNRRLMGIVGAAGMGALLQRVVAAATGVDERTVVLQNFVLMAAVAATGGLALHSGFFWSSGVLLLGLALTLSTTGHEGELFGIVCVFALGAAAWSWRSWRGEFTERGRDRG